MSAPAAFATTPDRDWTRTVKAMFSRLPTTYRLRIWLPQRLVVVTELAINEGPSITNAIEAVARDVEHVLRSLGWCAPHTRPLADGWSLCEHYEHATTPDTFDRVEFGRYERTGFETMEPQQPRWSPWVDREVVS